jgi:hypothetical protein
MSCVWRVSEKTTSQIFLAHLMEKPIAKWMAKLVRCVAPGRLHDNVESGSSSGCNAHCGKERLLGETHVGD